MKSFDINYKIDVLEKYFEDSDCIDINTVYEGEPIGEWLFQIKHAIKTGEIRIEQIHNKILLKYIKSGVNHSKDRAERLIHFVSKYSDIWYPNTRKLETKLKEIAENGGDQELILFLYEQAKDDYEALRAIKSRYFESKSRGQNGAYDIDEYTLERIRNAGVGKSFGLSDENEKDYNRLVEECGLDKDIVNYIFRNFSSYQKFKDIYITSLARDEKVELVPKAFVSKMNYVTCVDISDSKDCNSNPGYAHLLKTIMGVKFLVYDGTNLDERMKLFLEDNRGGAKTTLTEKEKEVINYLFGIGGKKLTLEEIAEKTGVSGTRVFQLRKRGINRLIQRRKQLEDLVYITDEKEVQSFMVEYFQKHDIFHSHGVQKVIVNESREDDNEYFTGVTRNLKSNINSVLEEQGYVVAEMKEEIQRKLSSVNAISSNKLFVKNLSIEYLNLSNRTCHCLSQNGVTTVGDLILFSRKCKYTMVRTVKHMGETSYAELKRCCELVKSYTRRRKQKSRNY